jgi:hypothetical protein
MKSRGSKKTTATPSRVSSSRSPRERTALTGLLGGSAAPRPPVSVKEPLAARAGRRSTPAGDVRFLEDKVLTELEQQSPAGLTAAQIIEAFVRRGIHLSEATFRKYVQLGLLGRSRRIGRKGKHQGSLGVYPATTVRRVNAIKQMMAAHYTIEDIQRSFLRFTEEIEAQKRGLAQLLDGFAAELAAGQFPAERRRALAREIEAARTLAEQLGQRVDSLERQLVSPLERAARERALGTGAKGGTDELL